MHSLFTYEDKSTSGIKKSPKEFKPFTQNEGIAVNCGETDTSYVWAVLPRHGPHLEGLKQRYLPGEEFNATCWSSPSKPAATLRWYINDQPYGDKKGLFN
ncbi:hypothetical protein LAZ67_15000731 [Cordylochernes scorpioides]|uniref:CD80-like immunoglobulin C2-set domain-containing protein n=1 Tax=Cordylochernes scorpioides TaxID=51811 RepID=A0ABY6LAW2_9ARAC|nr:hypothetical protein LAZ67_15000731 [Cordylochernes scorpioides]